MNVCYILYIVVSLSLSLSLVFLASCVIKNKLRMRRVGQRQAKWATIRISTTKFAPLFTETAGRRQQEHSSPRTFVKLFTGCQGGGDRDVQR